MVGLLCGTPLATASNVSAPWKVLSPATASGGVRGVRGHLVSRRAACPGPPRQPAGRAEPEAVDRWRPPRPPNGSSEPLPGADLREAVHAVGGQPTLRCGRAADASGGPRPGAPVERRLTPCVPLADACQGQDGRPRRRSYPLLPGASPYRGTSARRGVTRTVPVRMGIRLGEHQLPAARDASHRRSAWDARRADTGDSGIHWRPYALACWYPARTSRIAAHWSTTGRCWPSRLPGSCSWLSAAR